jgi:hypothetical protein
MYISFHDVLHDVEVPSKGSINPNVRSIVGATESNLRGSRHAMG